MFNFDVNQFTEQIKPALEKFAATLNTTADKLLTIGVRGMFVEGILAIIWCIISVVVVLVAIHIGRKGWSMFCSRASSDAEEVGGFFLMVGMGIVVLMAGGAFVGSLPTAVINTAAPDYALLLKASELILKK